MHAAGAGEVIESNEDFVEENKEKVIDTNNEYARPPYRQRLTDLPAKYDTIASRMVRLIAPDAWGRRRKVLATLPRKVTWGAVCYWMRDDAHLPADVAAAWKEWMRRDIAKRLDAEAQVGAREEMQKNRIVRRPGNFKPGNDAWRRRTAA